MVSPMPIVGAVISPNHDWCSTIHHRRLGDNHGRGVDDDRRWGSDHNRRRSDNHRNPDTYGYPSPGMCRLPDSNHEILYARQYRLF